MDWGQHISDISSKVINVCDALTLLMDNILYDLALRCIEKLQGIHWTLIVLPWLQIYSCFVMYGTLW